MGAGTGNKRRVLTGIRTGRYTFGVNTPHLPAVRPISPGRALLVILLPAICLSCAQPDPATTVTVALASDIAPAFRPLLKTPNAFGGYSIAVAEGPARSLHRRIVQDGYSPDVLITSDTGDFMATVMNAQKAVPYTIARRGEQDIVFSALPGSKKAQGALNVRDFLLGAEAASRLKSVGVTVVPLPGTDDPIEAMNKETLTLEPVPGMPAGLGAGYHR